MTAARDEEFSAYFAVRRDPVRRLAFLLSGDWHKADDLAQTAFLKLYGAWDRVRDRSSMDAYVRSCLVRSVVDESRRPWRREKVVEFLPENADDGGPDLAALVSDREVFRAALAEVPPKQRTVLVLRYYEGMDVASTAAAMGITTGTVKSQTARGLAALRIAVEALGVTGPRHERDDDVAGTGGPPSTDDTDDTEGRARR
ncbi:SigE family RNA polymerase sigma factor [Nakamurella deserti]|uniref:SigE family RNA polymerase sigma factor n=1 Tax=Nakamurella deserti TaxID=2164074 RepID=UPI000DBE657D|nr:SigE family RNA polymerase sigma factor [Nakamurella deserti]